MLKELREARGLTQKQLATLADVPQQWVSAVEISPKKQKNIPLKSAAKLAQALDVSIHDLYYNYLINTGAQ